MDERARRHSHSARPCHLSITSGQFTIRDFRAPDRPSQRHLRLVAGYEILEEIGQGGMGIVYKARQIQLGRLVALKMLRAREAGREDLLRFRTEAEAVASLQHPGIIQIHEIGEHDGRPFITLEYVSGGNLEQFLSGKPLVPVQAASLVASLADAIHFAHLHGIIHRDLKPANVLMQTSESARRPDGQVQPSAETLTYSSLSNPPSPAPFVPKITDFGLARKIDAIGQTTAGEVLGTPGYMAPEQAEGRTADIGPPTDIWALGVILYECLTGNPPFIANSVLETLEQVRRHDPARPRSVRPIVPRDLEIICLKCLEKDPSRRYGSAAELAAELRRYLAGEPILARPVGTLERWAKWAWRRPTAAALVGVSAALVTVLLAAVPIHMVHLKHQIDEVRAHWAITHEQKRLADLRNDAQTRLSSGKDYLKSGKLGEVQRAAMDFSIVLEQIPDTDAEQSFELARLRQEAKELRQQAEDRLHHLLGASAARISMKQFLARRDEAFFQLHRDLIGGQDDAQPHVCLEVARNALEEFPDLKCLDEQEQNTLRTARQEVYLLLAEATARMGDQESLREAIDLVDRAAKADQPRHGLLLRKARYLDLLGDRTQADTVRTQARTIPLRGGFDSFLMALEHWHRDQLPSALSHLERAVAEEPNWFWPRLLRAIALDKMQKHADARAELGQCVKLRPDFPWSYLIRAVLYTRAGRLDVAMSDLNAVSQMKLDRAAEYVLYLERGLLHRMKGEAKAAVGDFQRAVRVWPSHYHAYANLAIAYKDRQQYDRALAALDHAIRLAPFHPALYRTRGQLHAQLKNYSQALADIERTIDLEPRHRSNADKAADLRERARLLYQTRNYEDSLESCRDAVRMNGNDLEAVRLLAEVLLEQGQYREAVITFNHYLQKGKPDIEIYRRRARARAGAGDLTGVIDDYTLALSISRDPGLLTSRGWAYLVNNAPKPAFGDFEAALKLKPHHAEALIGRALARIDLHEFKAALSDLEEGLKQKLTGTRVLYQTARGFARCASSLNDRSSNTLRDRAVSLLSQTLESIPADRRAKFWRDQVSRDAVFRSFSSHLGFSRLAKRFVLPNSMQ